MIPFDQLCRQINQKSSWARLQDFQRRGLLSLWNSRRKAARVSKAQDTSLTLTYSVMKQIILSPDLSLLIFLGRGCLCLCWSCIPQRNAVQMAPCAAEEWLSPRLFCSISFGDGKRLVSLSITLLWKEKRKKKAPIGIISWHTCTCPFCQGMCCASTVNCWKCKVAVKHHVLVLTKNQQPFAFNRGSVA